MDRFFRKYIWDEERTPHLVPVARMTRRQAEYEVLFYAVLSGVLFAVIAVAALSTRLPHGDASGVSLYAFALVCAAVLLGATLSVGAALFCASAPVAMLLYFALYGFHPGLGIADKILLVVVLLIWLRYGGRLIAITRAYPNLR